MVANTCPSEYMKTMQEMPKSEYMKTMQEYNILLMVSQISQTKSETKSH